MSAKKNILKLHVLAPRAHRHATHAGPNLRAGRVPPLHSSGPARHRALPSNRKQRSP